MNCENCNSPLEKNAKFCGECGHPVPEPSVADSHTTRCSNCGSPLEPGAQFCGECGAPTSDGVPAPRIDPEATVLEQPPAQPVAPAPASKPRVAPPVSPHLTSVEPKETPSQPATPPPQQPASPPPGTPAQQPVYQQPPHEPPKKGLSGCRIVLIIIGLVVICCVGTMAIGWYAINNMEIDYSTTGFDFLEQLDSEGFFDQFRQGEFSFSGDPTQDDFFGTQVDLTLRNDFSFPACFVYISPTDSDDWGDDWLGEEEVIGPGASRTFQFAPDQSVDISVLDCDGNLIYEEYQIILSGEEVFITLESTP